MYKFDFTFSKKHFKAMLMKKTVKDSVEDENL